MSTTLVSIDAVLIRNSDSRPLLIPAQSSACGACGMCGSAARSAELPDDAAVLRLSLPGGALAMIAIGMYGIPFAGLLFGALLAAACGAGDAVAAGAGAAGCLIAVGISGRVTRRVEKRTLGELVIRPSATSQHSRRTAAVQAAGGRE